MKRDDRTYPVDPAFMQPCPNRAEKIKTDFQAIISVAMEKREENDMNDICADNRFEVIERAKKDIIESTNIESREEEMEVLDDFLYRCWQMGWLKKYEDEIKLIQKAVESVNRLRTEYDTAKERLRMDFIEDALRRL